MLRILALKGLHGVSLIAGLALLSFVLVSFSPIDPVRAYIGAAEPRMSPEQKERIAQRWGLDQPATVRFAKWAARLAKGDFGVSRIFNKPVLDVIRERFWVSVNLMAAAWALSGVLGFVLGVVAGAWRGSLWDRCIRLYAYILASTPAFWLGMLLLVAFSVKLGLAPICCASPVGVPYAEATLGEKLRHLALPALTLSIVGVANVALHTRQKLLEVLESDYVLFARAQGQSTWGIVRRHGLRNILLPAVTLQFASFSELFGGAVLAEQVFSYPGLGEATVLAGVRSDVPLLMGLVLFSAVFVFVGNTLADVVYRWVDPRIRLGWQG